MKKATIIVKDEVNIKIEGLELSTRRKLTGKFKYEIPGARYMPAVRLGRWDGKVAFFQLGGSSYVNLLPEIIPVLIEENYEVELDDRRDYQVDYSLDQVHANTFSHIKWPETHPVAGEPIVLRDYQIEVTNKFLSTPQCIQEVATGAGKCQPLDAKIKTPDGWTTMGRIKKGDLVTTPDGTSVPVLEVHDAGYKDVYKITFFDGRSAKCCEDHIWPVHNIGWRRSKTGPWRNLSLREIIELKNKTCRSIGIPLVTMENDDKDSDVPLDPWLMGFLLGDGCFRANRITFSSADKELIEKVSDKLGDDYTIKHLSKYDYAIVFADKKTKNKQRSEYFKSKNRDTQGHIILEQRGSYHFYNKILIEQGLFNLKSHEKFIPESYFLASRRQRIELIRGLVDSDGTIDNGSIVFSTTSKKLALDFQRLVRSVGGIANLSTKTNCTYVYKGERLPCRDSYNVRVKFKEPWNYISLQRKKDATGYSYQYGDTLKLNIDKIERISYEPVRCIMIDHPDHLYITDDYVVTHNTIITAALSHSIEHYGRSVVIVPNKSLVTQTEKDYRNMGLDVGVFYGDRKEFDHQHTICTWQSLDVLLKNTKNQTTEISIGEFLEGVVCVIVDEAHTSKADALRSLLTGPMSHIPIRWGLTGTVPKEEYAYQSLRVSIGPVESQLSASELQQRGILANCHVNVVQMVDYVEHTNYQSELKYLLEEPGRLDMMSRIIQQASESGNVLVLVDRVSAGKSLEMRLKNSVFISGSTKATDRQEHYDQVADSEGKIIIATYGVAAVGINLPRIFNLVLIEPGKSFVRVIQSIGRGIRKSHDKDFVQIWDITSTCKFAKRHLTKRKRFYKEAQYPFSIEKMNWQD